MRSIFSCIEKTRRIARRVFNDKNLFHSIPNEFLSIKRIKDSTEGISRAVV